MGTSVDIMLNVFVIDGKMMGWLYARRQRIEITRRRNRGRTHKQPVSVVEGREGDRVSSQARIVRARPPPRQSTTQNATKHPMGRAE